LLYGEAMRRKGEQGEGDLEEVEEEKDIE